MPQNRQSSTTFLNYRLPSTVESIQQGWLISCQSSTIISGLLAILSVILLIFLRGTSVPDPSAHGRRIRLAVDIVGYASLLLNSSACMSCFIILDRLGDVPYRAAQQTHAPKGGNISLPATGILRVYGISALWHWAVWHWLICFLSGFWCIVAQILLHVWTQGDRETRIAVSCLAGFCLLPCVSFVLAPLARLLAGIRTKEDPEMGIKTPELTLRVEEHPMTFTGITPSPLLTPQYSRPDLRGPASPATPTTDVQRHRHSGGS